MGNFCGSEEAEDLSGEVELRHFELLRSVGRGAFGKVMVVRKKDDGKVYALKYIDKAKCIKQKSVRNIIRERRILEEIHHPFVCNLRFAFQDDDYMYLVLDLMMGGDLRFHLDRLEFFSENVVRFQTAQIILGLEYLHAQNIVHRDIKPANILIDTLGNCHITDFNVATRIRPGKPITSTAGTYKYMAPEVILKKGYYESPDWWSLGIVMFECLYGKIPFRGKTKEQITVAICTNQLHYPSKSVQTLTKSTTSILLAFLQQDVEKRLGCTPDLPVQSHEFFESIDFQKVLKQSTDVVSPFVPDLTRHNFDMAYELEEVLLEENPLRYAKRKKGFTGDTVAASADTALFVEERLAMQREFRSYDYRKRLDANGQKISAECEGTGDVGKVLGGLGDFEELHEDIIKEYNGRETNTSIATN